MTDKEVSSLSKEEKRNYRNYKHQVLMATATTADDACENRVKRKIQDQE